jgi:hypothetical protein
VTDENNKYLNEKYGDIIRKFYYKDQLMPFWFECGDGWLTIIDELCGSIVHHIEQKKKSLDIKKENGEAITEEQYEELNLTVQQVKEKFGGLRFYIYGGDEYIRGMIAFAESMSYKTCESCGNPGKVGGKGWITTLCVPCREEKDKKEAEWRKNV